MVKKGKKFVRITPKSTKYIDYTQKARGELLINSSNLNICFLIFSMNEVIDKYQLEHKDILILMYLFELGLFSIYIDINTESKFSLNDYLKKGLIEEDFTNENKRLFRLSDAGIKLVRDVFYELEKSEVFKGRNREVDLDVESKAINFINSYGG